MIPLSTKKLSRRLLVSALLTMCSTLWAASNPYALSYRTHQWLTDAYRQLEEDKTDKALETLTSLLESLEADNYDFAVVQQTRANIFIEQERYADAIDAGESSLSTQALPQDRQQALQLNLGKLYLMTEQPKQAIPHLTAWEKAQTRKLSSNQYLMLAQPHYLLKHYAAALPYVNKAIAVTTPAKASLYELKLGLLHQLQRTDEVIRLLSYMVDQFPSEKRYWLQLASAQMSKGQDKQAFATYQLAMEKGLLTAEKERLQLIQFYAYFHHPYAAATLLSNSIKDGVIQSSEKHLENLAQLWMQAKEWQQAETTWLELLNQRVTRDRLTQLTRLYMQQNQWSNVIELLDQHHTYLTPFPEELQLFKAIALIRQEQYRTALPLLAHLEQSEDTGVREQARNWKQFAESKTG